MKEGGFGSERPPGRLSVKPRRRANKVEKPKRTSPSHTVANTLPKYNVSQTDEFQLSISIHIVLFHRGVIWEHNVGAIFRSFQFPASATGCGAPRTTLRVANTLILERDFSDFLPPSSPSIYPRRCIPSISPAITHTITISSLFLQQ